MGMTKTPEKFNGNWKSKDNQNTKKKDEDNEKQRIKTKGSSKKSNANEKVERNLETEQRKPINELKINGTEKQSNRNAKDSGKKRKRKEKDEEDEEESTLYAFPMQTVQTIMKSEGFDLKMNQEAYFLINKAMEKFMEQFCEEAYNSVPARDWRGNFKYRHLSSIVHMEKRYDFLTDFVPEKIKFEDALKEIKPTETLRE